MGSVMAVAQPMLFDHVDGPTGELVVKRVNYETARVPCEQWHYAGIMPSSFSHTYGIWEGGISRFTTVRQYYCTAS